MTNGKEVKEKGRFSLKSATFLFSLGLNSMQPYVIHRLLNQRARLQAPPPEVEIKPKYKPTDWEPDSDAYDTDLDEESEDVTKEGTPEYKAKMDSGIGLLLYKKICAQISSPPQSSIMFNLASSEVKIPDRQMGASNLTGLMCALLKNNRLTHLDLSNNHLGFDGGREVTTVLLANTFVQYLNLSSNGFGAVGVSAFLAKLMRTNRILNEVDISFNNFTDEDAKYLASGIEANESITKLDLSHNFINEDGAKYIGKGLAANDTLEDLDLSWNSIRRKGAVVMCQALKRNYSLRKVNLSWNGLCYEGALAVRDALVVNKHLVEVDISNNRINWDGAQFLAEMLEHNCYLEILRVGDNPLTTTGCLDIIDAIDRNENTGLQVLDITGVPVVKDFVIMTKKIHQSGRPIEFQHGEVVPHPDVLGQRFDRKIHPMQKIINYMYEKELRPLELLRSFDKDGKFMVTADEFIAKLLAKGIDIKSWEKDELMQYVSGKGFGKGGLVDYKKLVDSVVTQIDNERNYRIGQRERGKAMQRFHNKILQTNLPPLNVDAALVQITGIKTSDAEQNPDDVAARCMAETIIKRSEYGYDRKMALAKNIKAVDPSHHVTPKLSQFEEKDHGDTIQLIPRPASKVLMSSPLSRIKSTKSTRKKRAQRLKSAY